MPPKLRQYINRSILVSIPAVFEDGTCRAHTLQSIEDDGLWLSSDELVARLLPKHDRKSAGSLQPVFVPFARIAAIILPPPAAVTARPADATAAPAASSQKPTVTAAKPAPPKRGKAAAAGHAASAPATAGTKQNR